MYDLHTHSNFSDGTLPPEKIIEEAGKRGLTLVSLTDHDTAEGVMRAALFADRLRVPFISGIEIEAEFPCELHILGLGINPTAPALRGFMSSQRAHRAERNERLAKLINENVMDISELVKDVPGASKSDFADALVKAGRFRDRREVFDKLLLRGRPLYVPMEHPTMPEVMDIITAAGGVSVLAHPMKMDCDHRALIKEMKDRGLWGIEAYYSAATPEQTDFFRSLAKEFVLRPTCGSDFHGCGVGHGGEMGSAWRYSEELELTEQMLKDLAGISPAFPAGRLVRRAARRTRGVSEGRFQLLAEEITAELPEEFFKGLNGGVVIAEREKLHKKSLPERPLYVLGEYNYGGHEGRYITLYYGSFMRVHGAKSDAELKEELRKVILHEFRHHLETRAGEHTLEYEDAAYIADYMDGEE
jgi:predicted metal-dependent phosphoesterase TrpH/predicted Zn-dependent protease with MMP-like domain